jgi:hypothetical protein
MLPLDAVNSSSSVCVRRVVGMFNFCWVLFNVFGNLEMFLISVFRH